MLAGGLGDGASFHTSAQIMRRSMLIRQALIDSFNQLMTIHWGIKYNEYFEDGNYPWQFDFYSDQSAAATEALTNKQTRMNTLAITAQSLGALKELGLKKESVQIMLEEIGGLDIDQAERIAIDFANAPNPNDPGAMGDIGAPAQDMGDDPIDDDIDGALSDEDEL